MLSSVLGAKRIHSCELCYNVLGWVLQQLGDSIELDLEDIKPSVWMTEN